MSYFNSIILIFCLLIILPFLPCPVGFDMLEKGYRRIVLLTKGSERLLLSNLSILPLHRKTKRGKVEEILKLDYSFL